MPEIPTCDFYDCGAAVCPEDIDLPAPSLRFCQQHHDELDELLLDEKKIPQLLQWWVKSHGGAKNFATKMIGNAR